PDSGISKTRRSSIVISPNGLLSSLGVCQHQDESNPFLFAKKKSTHHVLFEQRRNFKVISRLRTSLSRALTFHLSTVIDVCLEADGISATGGSAFG
ncbi:MAG TPA: hypothetical protein VIH18_11340, partial [Candidatus Binatia bacterium]